MPFVDAKGVRLFYTDDETPDAPVVVLVHGWACDSQDWCGLLAELSGRFRLIALDLRGHGRSEVTPDGYHPECFARDAWYALDALGVTMPVLVGHSLGGVVVDVMAVQRPGAVAAVATIEPALGFDTAFAAAVPERVAAYGAPDGLAAVARFFGGMTYGEGAPPWLRGFHQRRVLGMPQHVVVDTFAGLYTGPGRYGLMPASAALLQARRCPTLGLYGRPARAALEAGIVAAPSQVRVWDGAGHFPHQERPRAFAALLREWLDRVAPGPAAA